MHGDIGLVFGMMSGRLQHDDGHQHDDRAFCQSYASVLPKIGHQHNSTSDCLGISMVTIRTFSMITGHFLRKFFLRALCSFFRACQVGRPAASVPGPPALSIPGVLPRSGFHQRIEKLL